MLNKDEKSILVNAVMNVGGYPIFPERVLELLNIKNNKYYREYLFDTLLEYRKDDVVNLVELDKKNIACYLYACLIFMDENDAGAVMDCNLADLHETYKKIIHEWDINEDDYKPILDKLKEEVQKKTD